MMFSLLPAAVRPRVVAFCALLAGFYLVITMYIPNDNSIDSRRNPAPSPHLIPNHVADKVTLVSPRYDSIRIGAVLHFHIHSGLTNSGGEFYQATMTSRLNAGDSTAGHFVDHANGTYSVYFFAGWSGEATLSIVRVLRREAVTFLRDVVWNAEDRVVWKGYFDVGGARGHSIQTGLCKLRGRGNWSGMCVYPHLKALGSTVFLCQKLPGVDCDSLYATKSDGYLIQKKAKELATGKERLFNNNQDYREHIHLANSTITISGSFRPAAVDKPKIPRCLPDGDLPLSHGYWLGGRWVSLICNMTDWTSPRKLSSCLRNKFLLLLGDSTTRQWFLTIHRLLLVQFKDRPTEKHFTLRRYLSFLNLTVLFTSPPQLIGNRLVFMSEVNYEVDVLDGLNDSYCNYVVLVSPWAHFTQWVRSQYVERTRLLREALLRLREMCPDVKIVLKGPHARNHPSVPSVVYSSDFFLREIDKINRKSFSGIGVWYLPTWAMNMAYPAMNTVHMPEQVILEELKMFFSYVCEN